MLLKNYIPVDNWVAALRRILIHDLALRSILWHKLSKKSNFSFSNLKVLTPIFGPTFFYFPLQPKWNHRHIVGYLQLTHEKIQCCRTKGTLCNKKLNKMGEKCCMELSLYFTWEGNQAFIKDLACFACFHCTYPWQIKL